MAVDALFLTEKIVYIRGMHDSSLPSFDAKLDRLKETLAHLFRTRGDADTWNLSRGTPPFVLKEVMAMRPLDTSMPVEYGGRGADPTEILATLEATAYESLPLGLIMGISGALFVEPLSKHGTAEVVAPVFARIRNEGALGGLMITEPDYGTDALSMQSFHTRSGEEYRVQGIKHWAGLSGWADYWLVTARRQKEDGMLNRDIDFFLCDSRDARQLVRPEEYYHNLGLYMIPYARNRVDVRVPERNKLSSAHSGLALLQDLLHRSRMRFPGMALGFVRRVFDEAVQHCGRRRVGGRVLASYDQVQRRLSQIQAWMTTAAAFCRHAARNSSIKLDLVGSALMANIHKTVMSDFMQRSSQSLLQLVGAAGYRQDHFAGRSTADSRPFQIFEGSNDVIYHQIADAILKPLLRGGGGHVGEVLAAHAATARGFDAVREWFDFRLTAAPAQRKLVDLGQAFSRVAAIGLNLELADAGYAAPLVSRAVSHLREEIGGLIGSYRSAAEEDVYEGASEVDWRGGLVGA